MDELGRAEALCRRAATFMRLALSLVILLLMLAGNSMAAEQKHALIRIQGHLSSINLLLQEADELGCGKAATYERSRVLLNQINHGLEVFIKDGYGSSRDKFSPYQSHYICQRWQELERNARVIDQLKSLERLVYESEQISVNRDKLFFDFSMLRQDIGQLIRITRLNMSKAPTPRGYTQ